VINILSHLFQVSHQYKKKWNTLSNILSMHFTRILWLKNKTIIPLVLILYNTKFKKYYYINPRYLNRTQNVVDN
jgi:hypothetical protein